MKTVWKRKIAVVLAAVTLTTAVFYGYGAEKIKEAKAETVSGRGAVGISVVSHSKEEIRTYLKQHPVNLTKFGNSVIYEQEPVTTAPYSPGKLSAQTNEKALTALNAIRYIAGIPDDVALDETYEAKVQAGALINYVNGKMSHTPAQPSDMPKELYDLGYSGTSSSNIAWASWNSVSFEYTLVHSWMADDDAGNIDRVGHRRWILNPGMGKTGFGAVNGSKGTYSGMYSFDRSGKGSASGVCWPAQVMPLEFFDDEYPWSISMGGDVDESKVQLTLTRKSDGKTWNFSSSQADGAFYVNNELYGQKGCIIFRPDEISYRDGDVFEVEISGLSQPVSYEVEFFALEEPKPSASPKPTVRPSTRPSTRPSASPTKAPGASPGILPTSNPSASPAATPAEYADFVCYDYEEDSVCIAGYTGKDKVVRVPEKIDGKTVYAVSDAFRGNTEIEELYLPETVKVLSPRAFEDCSSLRIVNVGGFSEVSYGYFRTDILFSGCTSIEKFMTGDTADFPIQTNGDTVDLFYRDILDQLTYIYIGDSMSDVSERLFYGNSLEWIEIGAENKVYSSHDGIVYSADGRELIVCGTSYLEERVEIPYGVEKIGNIGFEGCKGIHFVKIPETVTEILDNAFWGMDVTIEAKENSYAAQFAEKSGIPLKYFGTALPEATSQPTKEPEPTSSPEPELTPAPGYPQPEVPTQVPPVCTSPVSKPANPTGKPQTGIVPGVVMPGGVNANDTVSSEETKSLTGAKAAGAKPGRAVIRKLRNKKTRIVQVELKKQSFISGYQVQYGTRKNMKPAKNILVKKTKVSLKNLKKNSIYYIRARAYRIQNGKRVYGSWSKSKKIKVK